MRSDLPTVMIAARGQTAGAFVGQIPTAWRHGAVILADHTQGDSVAALAARILQVAPLRFRPIGFSMVANQNSATIVRSDRRPRIK